MEPGRRRWLLQGRRHSRRGAVATIAIVAAIGLASCGATSDVGGDVPSSTTDATTMTAVSPTTAVASSDPASLIIDRLFEAFNEEDAEGVAGVFGDDVVYVLHDDDEELVGADATTYWQGYFGSETGTRITDPFHGADGRTYFLGVFEFSNGASNTYVFDVEMDGDRLVRMGDRIREFGEVVAAREIDDIYEAFNDQDVDRLIEEFEGMTYRSASGVEFAGAEAAEHWADAFGLVATRTSGVFATGDGAFGFVMEYREPDSGLSTSYIIEVERAGGQITSMIERPLNT